MEMFTEAHFWVGWGIGLACGLGAPVLFRLAGRGRKRRRRGPGPLPTPKEWENGSPGNGPARDKLGRRTVWDIED